MRRDIVSLKDLPLVTRIVCVVEQGLVHVLLPLVFILLAVRARKEPAHLHHLSHRLGFSPPCPKGAVWVFAASLGETRAASPLIRRLRAAGHHVILSHQSPAGLAEGARLFAQDEGVTQCYVPLDVFWAVRLFLRRTRPVALVVMEIELWPAMLFETVRKGIPAVMANGNLLERSIGNGRGLRGQVLKLYYLFSHIFTRTQEYSDRYSRIGVDPSRVSVVGDMKFDQLIDPTHLALSDRLRTAFDGGARVLMIASSVEAEERILLPMVARLLAADSGLRVLWAPRSPQRFQAVADALVSLGLTVAQRSSFGADAGATLPQVQVLVGDSTGEMNAYYPLADLVFVGASLVDHGGHNIVEPMALGRPVVMGPSTYGIDFVAEPAARVGAFESLPDAAALEARIAALLADPSALAQMGAAAEAFMANQTGASDRTFSGLQPLLTLDAKGANR
ncbi:3-deoxy-D-manno-octulosonic acid transferase [Celeribacter sp.]|uniref:3-deoxy-D-manno-octulosonic acid transferase n=1 Tax=Celeribacter sp. TaxID=1890673 RepID=UPI003A8FD917